MSTRFTRRAARLAAPLLLIGVLGGIVAADSGGPVQRELPEIQPGVAPRTAPDFSLSNLHGERLQLANVDAPVILLHFWTKYRDCKYDLELLQRLHTKYADRGVRIIGLVYNSGTREEVDAFVSELGVEFPTLMCSTPVREAYDVATFPTTFLLDGKKRVRYWMYGILVEKHWDQIIAELLEDETP